ncbi:MAG: hypothetical protein KF820_05345 [Candidatus Paracaedibacteraceae bacterium]|nr:hypothetical protein [Candidatus Paracaedibacteraceae bacterium]
MNITKMLCLASSVLSVYAADDSRPTSVRFGSSNIEKVIEPSFAEKTDIARLFMASLTSDVDALGLSQADINHIYKIYQLTEHSKNTSSRTRSRFVSDNIEFPRLFWGIDLHEFLKSQLPSLPQKGVDGYQKAFVRSDIQPSSTSTVYAQSRLQCLVEDISVLEFLASRPNILAWCSHSEPNPAEGTNALPKTTVRYAFYEIPNYLSLILKHYYPVLGGHIDAIITSLQLKPLTYADIRERIGEDANWQTVKTNLGSKKLKFEISGIFTQRTANSPKGDEKSLKQLFNQSIKNFRSVMQSESQADQSMVASSSTSGIPPAKREKAQRRKSSVTKRA